MIEDRSDSALFSIKLLRSPKAISSVSTIFSPINVPTIFASSHGTPIDQAIGLNKKPNISCNEVSAKPKIKLTKIITSKTFKSPSSLISPIASY